MYGIVGVVTGPESIAVCIKRCTCRSIFKITNISFPLITFKRENAESCTRISSYFFSKSDNFKVS